MLPLDIVAVVVSYLDIVTDDEVLAVFDNADARLRIRDVWLRHTSIQRVEHKRERQIATYQYVNNQLHSFPWSDEPTVVYKDGSKWWYRAGELHRDKDRPAIIEADGECKWYRHGVLHRDYDEPAVITPKGPRRGQWWYRMGVLHRDGDKPAEIYYGHYGGCDVMIWRKDGKRHRDGDEPAEIHSDGYRAWYQNDKLHRDNDRPAIIHANGKREWYRRGNYFRYGNAPVIVTGTGIDWILMNGKPTPACINMLTNG